MLHRRLCRSVGRTWLWAVLSSIVVIELLSFFFSSRRRHTRSLCDWSSDVCSSDLSVMCRSSGFAAFARGFAFGLALVLALAFAFGFAIAYSPAFAFAGVTSTRWRT